MVCDRNHTIIYGTRLWPYHSCIIFTGLVLRQNSTKDPDRYNCIYHIVIDHIYDNIQIKAINTK